MKIEEENKPEDKQEREVKWKEIKDSRLLIKVPTSEFVGGDGQVYKKVEWVEPAGEINLGSVVKPQNEHLLGFKWIVPQRRKSHPFEGLFGNMFGGED